MNINRLNCTSVQNYSRSFGAKVIDNLSAESKDAWLDTTASATRDLKAGLAYEKLKGYMIVVKDGKERFVADIIKAGKAQGKLENFDLKKGARVIESMTGWNVHDLVSRAKTFAIGDSIVDKVKIKQSVISKFLKMIRL